MSLTARGIDYGADQDLLARIVWQHVEQGAVLFAPPALERGLVGEAQGALQRLFACLPAGGRSRRYVGIGWSAGGHFVRATFHFEHTASPGTLGALPYGGGGSLLLVESVEEGVVEGQWAAHVQDAGRRTGLGFGRLAPGSRVPT